MKETQDLDRKGRLIKKITSSITGWADMSPGASLKSEKVGKEIKVGLKASKATRHDQLVIMNRDDGKSE